MDLKGRNFLTLKDYTPQEITYLLELSAKYKAEKKAGVQEPVRTGKNIALIFEKTSTRTRCSFEVAADDLGMQCTYLDPSGSQIGKKESIRDTARVLGRMYDGIEYRGFGQEIVEELAKYAGVPVPSLHSPPAIPESFHLPSAQSPAVFLQLPGSFLHQILPLTVQGSHILPDIPGIIVLKSPCPWPVPCKVRRSLLCLSGMYFPEKQTDL